MGFPQSIGPTGPASGDLGGSYPSPSVTAIQGQPVILDGGELEWTVPLTSTGALTAADSLATEVKIGAVGPGAASGISFQAGEASSTLYRINAGQLRTDGAMTVGGTFNAIGNSIATGLISAAVGAATEVKIGAVGPGATSGITFQQAEAGSNLYRLSAGVLRTDGILVALGALAANTVLATEVVIGGARSSGMGIGTGALAGATNVGGTLSYGTGAPNNANGANGDIYMRVDGGALSTIYQRRLGVWAGIV